MRSALRLYGQATLREVGIALGRELRLRIPDPVMDSTWLVLAQIGEHLADALDEADYEQCGRRVARDAVDHVSMPDLVNAFHDLGWGGMSLPPRVELDFLHIALRDLFANKLGPFIDRMVQRWDNEGYLRLRPA